MPLLPANLGLLGLTAAADVTCKRSSRLSITARTATTQAAVSSCSCLRNTKRFRLHRSSDAGTRSFHATASICPKVNTSKHQNERSHIADAAVFSRSGLAERRKIQHSAPDAKSVTCGAIGRSCFAFLIIFRPPHSEMTPSDTFKSRRPHCH